MTPEEEEIYDLQGCKVYVRRDGSLAFKCKDDVKIEIGKMELRFFQGISEMVASIRKTTDEKVTNKNGPSHSD